MKTVDRIVSLVPSWTEAVFDLGAGDRVVGVTKYCVHPADLPERVERVGGSKRFDVDAVTRLRPDLVLVNDEENRLEDVERLVAAGLTTLDLSPRTVADTARHLRRLGAALECCGAGIMDRGRDAGAKVLAAVETAEAALDGLDAPFPVAYLIWRRPWMSIGADTFVHDMLRLAGAANVAGDAQDRYPTWDDAALAACGARAVLLPSEPYTWKEAEVADVAERTGVPAVRVDGEAFSWHGTRTPAGIRTACQTIAALRAESA